MWSDVSRGAQPRTHRAQIRGAPTTTLPPDYFFPTTTLTTTLPAESADGGRQQVSEIAGALKIDTESILYSVETCGMSQSHAWPKR